MKTILGQITDELGELGKKVVKETTKAPVDIARGVFEKRYEQPKQKTPFDVLEKVKTEKEKRPLARGVLQHLKIGEKKPEPPVYERIQREKKERERLQQGRAKKAAWQQLPKTGARARRGDPGTIAKKLAHPEQAKNIVHQ